MSSQTAVLRQEVVQAIERIDLALHLAWSDTRNRYRRSVLGPFWLVMGTAIGVGGLGLVWGALFEVDRAVFVPSLTIGLVVWYFLAGSVVGGASVFYTNRELILNVPVSSLLISFQFMLRGVVNFLHNAVVIIIVFIIFPTTLSNTAWLAIPGFLLVCINMLWVIQLCGYIGARYRDLEPLLAAIMQPLFFLTPVIFRPEQLGAQAAVMALNPFAYWLELIREPLMGDVPSAMTWMVSMGMAVVGWAVAAYVTMTKRRRLAYWVS